MVAVTILSPTLTEVEQEERLPFAELPAGVGPAAVRRADLELRPEHAFVELDRLLDVPYTNVQSDGPKPP